MRLHNTKRESSPTLGEIPRLACHRLSTLTQWRGGLAWRHTGRTGYIEALEPRSALQDQANGTRLPEVGAVQFDLPDYFT